MDSHKIAAVYSAMANMVNANPIKLKVGDIDEWGAKEYSRDPTIHQWPVKNLQDVLAYLFPDSSIGEPDGMYGANTAAALELAVSTGEYDSMLHLPALIPMLAEKAVVDLTNLERKPGTFGPIAVPKEKENAGVIRPMLVDPLPIHYNQADPAWAARKMGTDMPFKKGACAICCLSALFDWIHYFDTEQSACINPVKLDDWMDKNEGYYTYPDGRKTNMLVWGKMVAAARDLAGVGLIHRPWGSKDQPLPHEGGLEMARKMLNEDKWPLILRVKYRQTVSKQWFNHFVLGVGINEYGEVRFLDPRNAIGGDLNEPQNDTGQTVTKGGYNIVAIEQFTRGVA